MKTISLCFLTPLMLLAVSVAHTAFADIQPAPNYVVNTLDDTNDGSCDVLGTGGGNQGCSLREAVHAAGGQGDGAKISFGVSGTIVLGSTLPEISTRMTIDGSSQSVIISGNNSVRIFEISTTLERKTINFNALTISHGASNRGAMSVRFATVNFTNCTFSDNNAIGFGPGGAMYLDTASTITVANCTFSNNSGRFGGAIYIAGTAGATSSLNVSNSTFADNKLVDPPATAGANIHASNAAVAIKNSILIRDETKSGWSNCVGVSSSDSHTFANDNTCSSPVATRAQLNLDTLKDNGGPTKTFALLPGSVAINAADNAVCAAAPISGTDQRGRERTFASSATCDVGAYEAGSSGSRQVNTVADVVSTSDRQTSLREALVFAQSLGGPQTVTFAPALAGQTVMLHTGWNSPGDDTALFVTGQITLQGLIAEPGVTIAIAPALAKRHLLVQSGGNLTVSDLTFTNGTSERGGSIKNFGTLAVRNCSFTYNTASQDGGAIHSEPGSPSLLIENSTFSSNSCPVQASAIATGAQETTCRYLTITQNSGTGGAGAFLIFQNPTTIVNSIIAGNENDHVIALGGAAFTAQSTNNIFGSTDAGSLSNGTNGNRTGVPAAQVELAPLNDNGGSTPTCGLGGNSIALDAGANIPGLSTDQRGIARPQLNAPDIGAYELASGPGSLVVTTVVDEKNGTSDPAFGTGTSLREALIFAHSLTGAQTVTFAPALAGQTVTLSTAWDNANAYNSSSAVRVDGNVTVEGPTNAPGITLRVGDAAQLRHFVISSGGTLALKNLTLTGGKALLSDSNGNFAFGGAVWNFGTLAVRNCTFTGNTAGAEGGAIQTWGESPSLLIENSTFTGNHSDGNAGAINTGAVSMALRHVTISNNTSSDGTALVIYKYPLTMVNGLIAGNGSDGVASTSGGTFSATSTNNILSSASAPGLTNGANGNQLGVPANQLWLTSLANNGGPTPTIALQPGSLAIDAGVMSGGINADQRGVARPQQDLPDVGAFELVWVQAAAPVINPPEGDYERFAVISMTTTSSPNAFVRYTTDGVTSPSPTDGQLYTGPFTTDRTASYQAIAYGRGWIPSTVTLHNLSFSQPLTYWEDLHEISMAFHALENPSGDGIVNLLKYAFNLAPQAGDLQKARYQILPANGNAGLPSMARDAQGRLVLQFLRRKAFTNPGVSYIPESGSDLLTWTALDLTNAAIVSLDSVWERVTVTDPALGAKRFGRVRVTTLGNYGNDFDVVRGPARLRGSATWVNGAVQLTSGTAFGELGNLFLGNEKYFIEVGPELTGFTARFKLAMGPPATGNPGDGVCFAVGDLGFGPGQEPPLWGEAGPGTSHSLAVGFDTFDNGPGSGSKGIHVWVNGVHVAASPVDPYTNGVLVPVEITFEGNSQLTVKYNGATIFDRLPISGFQFEVPTPSNPVPETFGFGARTGAAVQRAVVDEVQIEPRL